MEVKSRSELMEAGWTARDITVAVRSGALIRARRNRYVHADAHKDLVKAVRVGGFLGCLSLLRALEVFVFSKPDLHVHMIRGASRMRSPKTASKRLPDRTRRKVTLHWHALVSEPQGGRVSLLDALIHAVRCQPPRHAIASIDSALNKGLLKVEELGALFAALPRRHQILRGFIDGRAQSGPETLVRLMLVALGCHVDLQVKFDAVGFVDLVADGWLVIECDSRSHHSSWQQQLKDYRRDVELAKQGYCVLRLTAEDILYRPDAVMEALRGLVHGRRTVR